MEKEMIVIVDGYRIGRFYPARFKARGYQCIHVHSGDPSLLGAHILGGYSSSDYETNIAYTADFKQLLSRLEVYPIKLVIPGNESGVELADKLSHALNLPANDFALSAARRNKYLMVEAIKKKGLAAVQHFISDDLHEIIAWAHKMDRWPLVAKPVDSAGTEGVTFCYSDSDITHAFHRVVGKHNMFGAKNTRLLMQTFLDGTEYIVNTVSIKGVHYLSDMWVYRKEQVSGAGLVYNYTKLLPYENEYRDVLVNYVFQVLDALGVKHGPVHAEVMLTKDGPVLVECGARVMGVVTPDVINLAIARNQMDLTIDAYLDPNFFLKQINQPYTIHNYLLIKSLIAAVAGTIEKINYLPQIKTLSSFYAMNLDVAVGGNLHKTIDLFTSPGMITLMHSDAAVVSSDCEKISKWEKDMFVVQDHSTELTLCRLLVLIIINAREHESAQK